MTPFPPRRGTRSRKLVVQEPNGPANKKTKRASVTKSQTSNKSKPSATIRPAPTTTIEGVSKEVSKKSSHPVDAEIQIKGQSPADFAVYQEKNGKWFDVVLNQCNIGNNNNKYYRLQILQAKSDPSRYYTWFKWGRVGETGKASASAWAGPVSIGEAKKSFGQKYRDKSGNGFGAKSFVEYSGKYVPVEIDNDVEVDEEFLDCSNRNAPCAKSSLDPTTKELIEVLFSKEMRNEALKEFSIDIKKLPLGAPSEQQIRRGIDVLNEIEEKLGNKQATTESLAGLSSRFYTAIPHAFGRSVPPTISNYEDLQVRYDMCNILMDMHETNETVRRIAKDRKMASTKLLPNPADEHYGSLNAKLTLLERSSAVFNDIQDYFDQTKNARWKMLNVWSVDRKGEAQRFEQFQHVGNRHLLWHGTNIAVAAPILTSGLRIMPHSGGRVGAGIYLANLQQKSAQYTTAYGNKFACMFLCEAPLGKEHTVNMDGPSASQLKKAPEGFDSVHAVGNVAPNTSKVVNIDGNEVIIPQGKPVSTSAGSSFCHDEFLVYTEAQVRIRYVLTVEQR